MKFHTVGLHAFYAAKKTVVSGAMMEAAIFTAGVKIITAAVKKGSMVAGNAWNFHVNAICLKNHEYVRL